MKAFFVKINLHNMKKSFGIVLIVVSLFQWACYRKDFDPAEQYITILVSDTIDTMRQITRFDTNYFKKTIDAIVAYPNSKPLKSDTNKIYPNGYGLKLEVNPNADSTLFIFKKNGKVVDSLLVTYTRSVEYYSRKSKYVMNLNDIKIKKHSFKQVARLSYFMYEYEEDNGIYFVP